MKWFTQRIRPRSFTIPTSPGWAKGRRASMDTEEAGSCRARHYDDTVLRVDRIQQLL